MVSEFGEWVDAAGKGSYVTDVTKVGSAKLSEVCIALSQRKVDRRRFDRRTSIRLGKSCRELLAENSQRTSCGPIPILDPLRKMLVFLAGPGNVFSPAGFAATRELHG